jgi:hypothetical protein
MQDPRLLPENQRLAGIVRLCLAKNLCGGVKLIRLWPIPLAGIQSSPSLQSGGFDALRRPVLSNQLAAAKLRNGGLLHGHASCRKWQKPGVLPLEGSKSASWLRFANLAG